MAMSLSSCGSSKGNKRCIGGFLDHTCAYVGVESLVSRHSFCTWSSNPPFPAVTEDTLPHLQCAFSGWRLLICVFHKSCCLAKVKGGFSLVSSATFLMSRLWPSGLIHQRPQCCWCLLVLLLIPKSCHIRKTTCKTQLGCMV